MSSCSSCSGSCISGHELQQLHPSIGVQLQRDCNSQQSGIPTECVACCAPLHAHNLTRLCAECKLIARNRRLSGQSTDTTEPVTYRQAITTITAILGGRIIATGKQLT